MPMCGAGFHTEFDKDGSGVAIEYSATAIFSPCKSPVVDSLGPPPSDWSPSRIVQGLFGTRGDAAHPFIVNPGSLPLPPHCYGWDGSSDYNTQTYYSFRNTLLQVVDDGIEFASISVKSIQVTVDYDVRLQRTFDQRKLVFSRPNFLSSFDFTTPDSDTCTNLSNSDVTTHHSEVVYFNGGQYGSGNWNSIELGDLSNAFKQSDGTFLTSYAWHHNQHKDSRYLDPNFVSDAIPPDGRWGRFSFAQNPSNGLEMWAIYKFGQEIQTVFNVRFTVNVSWVQFHCVPDDTGGGGPCNCNGDCPPCTGSMPSIGSGRCATICANSGSADSLVLGWTIKDGSGHVVASNDSLNGWGFSIVNTCAFRICVPCITQAQLLANNYEGPFTVVWGSGQPCVCDGTTHYKIYSGSFSVVADVICDQIITPKPGVTVSYDVSDARRHVRAFTTLKTDGVTYDKVHVGLASNVIPLDWKDITTDIVAKRFCIRWDRQSSGSTLYALAEGVNIQGGDQRAGQIHLYQSDKEGQSWDYKFRVDEGSAPNTRPVLLIARDGRRFCFWFQLGQAGVNGYILQKVYDAAWNVVQPTTKIFLAEDDDFNVDEFVGRNGEWSLPAFYTASGAHLHPTGFVGRDGRKFYYFVSSARIQYYILDGAGNSIQGTRVITSLGTVDDAQIAVDETIAQDGTWYVTLIYRSNGQIVTRSSKDGITFA